MFFWDIYVINTIVQYMKMDCGIYCVTLPWYYVIPSLYHVTVFSLLSSVIFPRCLLSCQGRFEVVSVACAKLVCHSHFYLFNLLWSHFHLAAHEAFVLRTECEDERWQQSLVDSVTVFILLDSAGPDVALEDSRCNRGCLRMK